MRTVSILTGLACLLAATACSHTRPVEHYEPLVMRPDFIISPDVQRHVEQRIDREFYSNRLY